MTLDKVAEDQVEHYDVVRKGYLRKLKKNKRRYFVLRTFSRYGRGRLECHNSEKKFKDGSNPGKTIFFSEIFNFAETNDEECPAGFAIFLKDEKFTLIADLIEDRDNWLEALKFVKNQGMMQGKLPKYEFLWKIHIKDQGVTRDTNLIGDHRLAKIGTNLSIMKRNTEEVIEQFQLSNIRQSGQADSFVLFEIGRSHPIGPGELWFEAQDKASAEDIHRILFSSSLVRPKSYINSEVPRPVTKTMTNRRRSDGADKTKPGKRSFLPFLRSKLKETEAYAEKSFTANPKRSLSAADIRRVGVNQNEDLYNKIFSGKCEQSLSSDVRKDSISSKKSRRLSLFRNKKHQMSISVQDLHIVNTREQRKETSTYRKSIVSSLKENYEKMLSKSAQNIHAVDHESNSPSQNSSRLENIKKLSQMRSTSDLHMANIGEKFHETDNFGYQRVIPNGRPVTMALNGSAEMTPVLRKNKWKSLDGNLKDSPAESSEDCSSIGSFDSDKPLLNSSDEAETTSDGKSLVDEGYMRMNYNNVEGITEQLPVTRNSVYVLVKPDSNLPKDEELPEEYMEMSPGNNLDFNTVLYGMKDSTEVASQQDRLDHMQVSPEPVKCNRQISEASSDDSDKVTCQRSISQQSVGSDSDKPSSASPTTPEKRGVSKFRDLRKQMTLNWRPNKNLPSPKKRYSEATSHFYVDTFPACDTEEKPGNDENDNWKADFRSCDSQCDESSIEISNQQMERKKPFPTRPNKLDLKTGETKDVQPSILSPVVESDWAIKVEDDANICVNEANIYETVRSDDTDLNSESVRKYSESNHRYQVDAKGSCFQSKKHHNYTRVGKSNDSFYTEVTLKEKLHSEMPSVKGNKSSSDERRQKSSKTTSSRKISSKILSSPTKETQGYENISLADGVITTPLDEIEGRPYVNLGFHQQEHNGKSKKVSAHKRRSGDDAALRELMAIQGGRKISNERKAITRSKSTGDSPPDDDYNVYDNIDNGDNDEAMYVNVNRENKNDLGRTDYAFDTSDVSRVNTRNATGDTKTEDNGNCTYENLSRHVQHSKATSVTTSVTTADLNANVKNVDNFEIKQKIRQSPTSKKKSCSNDVYANTEDVKRSNDIDHISNEISRAKINTPDNRPIPAPRPKKNGRKVGLAFPIDSQPNSPSKHNLFSVESPQKSPELGRSSYVNVGSYRDNFDAVTQSKLTSTSAKSRSYENLADEFPVRRNKKKSVDWNLAYADVNIQGKEHGEILYSYADIGPTKKPDSPGASRNSSDYESSPRAKHCAYTEVDFKKSQGISEAVREQRAESTESPEHEAQ